MGLFSSIGKIAGAVTGIGSLFGGNKAGQQQSELQKQQAGLVNKQANLYQNVGVPAYESALKGLMASYGWRPASQGAAGTSLGSPTTGTNNNFWRKPKTKAPPNNNYYADGSWGYYAGAGQQLGASTDTWNRARTRLDDMYKSGEIPQATYMAAVDRLERNRATEQQRLMIEAQRAGPTALLGALNPALKTGAAAVRGISNLSSQYGAQSQNWLAALSQLGRMMAGEQNTPTVNTGQPIGSLSNFTLNAPTSQAERMPTLLTQQMPGVAVPAGITAKWGPF